MSIVYSFLRSVLVAFTGRGYDRSASTNNIHHKLAYRLHRMLPVFGIRGEQVVDVPGVPGRRMIVRAEDGGVGHQILTYRSYEPFESELVRKHIVQGDVVYIIGANIGYYPVLCADRGARVFAFEPDPANLDLLVRTISMNGFSNVTIMPMALGLRDGGIVLSKSATNSGDHQTGTIEGREQIRVPIRSIASLVSDGVPPPNVILMDVQGAEWDVLRGAGSLLTQPTLRALFTEFWPGGLERREAGSAKQFVEELQSAGFQVLEIDERSKSLSPFTVRAIERMSVTEEKNFLCVRTGI